MDTFEFYFTTLYHKHFYFLHHYTLYVGHIVVLLFVSSELCRELVERGSQGSATCGCVAGSSFQPFLPGSRQKQSSVLCGQIRLPSLPVVLAYACLCQEISKEQKISHWKASAEQRALSEKIPRKKRGRGFSSSIWSWTGQTQYCCSLWVNLETCLCLQRLLRKRPLKWTSISIQLLQTHVSDEWRDVDEAEPDNQEPELPSRFSSLTDPNSGCQLCHHPRAPTLCRFL